MKGYFFITYAESNSATFKIPSFLISFMRSKKGLTEADWAMSMGIFILYLVWFFIVVRPIVAPDTKMSMPFDDLKDSFHENASWTINKTPIMIMSNITGNDEPIIVDFPYNGIAEQFYIDGKYIKIDEGKLFFLADLHSAGTGDNTLYYMYHSYQNYTVPDIYSDITSSEDSASTDSIKLNFDNGLIVQGFYGTSIGLYDYQLKVDGKDMDTSVSRQSYNKLFSKHKIITPLVNHTTYLILNNSRIYCYFDSREEKPVTVGTRIQRYPNFYISPSIGGKIEYNLSQCDTYTTDYADFYDDVDGVSFVFDDDVSLEICHYKNLSVTADFDVDGEFGYRLIFHKADESTRKMAEPYKLVFGAEEVLKGLSAERLFDLENQNLSTIRHDWGYSYTFNITVLNETGKAIFSIGDPPSRYATTQGETYNYHKLYNNGTMGRVEVVLLSW